MGCDRQLAFTRKSDRGGSLYGKDMGWSAHAGGRIPEAASAVSGDDSSLQRLGPRAAGRMQRFCALQLIRGQCRDNQGCLSARQGLSTWTLMFDVAVFLQGSPTFMWSA
eukprot:TRINITY_DN6876_c0_g1_i1.p2 TRINITY_DN6876_c0_g1~~TRINITY_DN6876_c0_g1_i1.p2  ORF type:complete len:109 (-),score=12.81 TRINITY_DN6876_c0_g1_i1:135-461(-)